MLPLILLFTLIGSVISLVGSIYLLIKRDLIERLSIHLINFAAGVLLAVAFLDLFPEAVEVSLGKNIFLPALLGFMFFFFAERFAQIFHRHHRHGEKPTVWLVLVGDSLHNFIDGVVITASFLTSVPLGITTSLAVAAHEIPQEIADISILLTNGLSRSKALVYNFASALMALAGALVAYFFASHVAANLYIFLSATSGFFIYIAASDLIPQIHERYQENRKFNHLFSFLAGIAMVYILGSFIGG